MGTLESPDDQFDYEEDDTVIIPPPAEPKVEQKPRKVEGVMDGSHAENLYEGRGHFETPHTSIVAGTDKGIGYSEVNEDRIAVNQEAEFVGVIDGMGGEGSGDKAAQIIAEELVASPTDMEAAIIRAQERILMKLGRGPGATVAAGRILERSGKGQLEYFRAGDAVVMVVRKGKVPLRTEDESVAAELKKAGMPAMPKFAQTVTNFITGSEGKVKIEHFDLQSGDKVLFLSDGITDNVTDEEIADAVSRLSPQQALQELSQKTARRMTKQEGRPDGEPTKPDNRSIAIMDIK